MNVFVFKQPSINVNAQNISNFTPLHSVTHLFKVNSAKNDPEKCKMLLEMGKMLINSKCNQSLLNVKKLTAKQLLPTEESKNKDIAKLCVLFVEVID